MQALNFTAKDKKLELEQLPIPKVTKPNQVLIKVAFSGICGTDLHIIEGEFPCNRKEKFTLGHEIGGTVVDIGSDVKIFKKGDKVAVDPNSGCSFCHHCHSGNPHFCSEGGINSTIGIYKNGGWAEYALAPVDQVHKVPEYITLEQAALLEPLSCLAHGWDIISPVVVGQKILITGAGIIGNLWVCNLHLQGHRNVTVSEPNKARLEMLKKLNTGYTLLTPDQLKKNQEANPKYLFDVVIDCSGFGPAIEHAVSLLNTGGKLCIFGVASPHVDIKRHRLLGLEDLSKKGSSKNIVEPDKCYWFLMMPNQPINQSIPIGNTGIKPFDIYFKELKIFGVQINPFSFPKSLGLVEAMGDRYLNYEHLGIKTFSLTDYKDAIGLLKKGTIAKAVFKM